MRRALIFLGRMGLLAISFVLICLIAMFIAKASGSLTGILLAYAISAIAAIAFVVLAVRMWIEFTKSINNAY